MSTKTKGLGRGLGAIFEIEGTDFSDNNNATPFRLMEELNVAVIVPNPNQPRTVFDAEALEELADSIRTLGVIQPITVKKDKDDRYLIISGERRWRASQLAGLTTIPAYIREADDQTLHEMSLVENIQRQDLNAMEIALSLQRLIDECAVTQDEVASRVGKKRSTVANYLRLLALPTEVQAAVKQELISMGHAKAIASAHEDKQLGVLKKVIKKGLSVRQTEELVKALNEERTRSAEESEDDIFPESYTRFAEYMSRLFSEDVKIKRSRNGSGKIIIGFTSDQEIESFLRRLEQISK